MKLRLTREEEKRLKEPGEISRLIGPGMKVSDCEIIIVTKAQKALLDAINEKIRNVPVRAMYGEDADEQPLMRSIRFAQQAFHAVQNSHSNYSIQSTEYLYFEQHGTRMPYDEKSRLAFFDRVGIALIEGDAEFFSKVARLLDTWVNTGALANKPAYYLCMAYEECLKYTSVKVPTKKQVKTRAIHNQAKHEILHGETEFSFFSPYYLNDGSLKPEFERKIKDKERQILGDLSGKRTVNWTRSFKAAGLSKLPADPGGQPSHKK